MHMANGSTFLLTLARNGHDNMVFLCYAILCEMDEAFFGALNFPFVSLLLL